MIVKYLGLFVFGSVCLGLALWFGSPFLFGMGASTLVVSLTAGAK